jgi:hypothetical protein
MFIVAFIRRANFRFFRECFDANLDTFFRQNEAKIPTVMRRDLAFTREEMFENAHKINRLTSLNITLDPHNINKTQEVSREKDETDTSNLIKLYYPQASFVQYLTILLSSFSRSY